MRQAEQPERRFFGDKTVRELLAQPVMTIGELQDSPGVQSRFARIINLARRMGKVVRRYRRAGAASDRAPSKKIAVSHFRFYGRRS